MSDSVDRVFVHALNTVKKIPRTGTARPPAAERLKLYGLYKQSMEGDVEGIMDRPIGDAPDVQAEREKWDAWYSQRGISRTEAKRRYITTLINTMHLYASQTAEARELVAELEFVWDQIKFNAASSSTSSSSPIQAGRTLPSVSVSAAGAPRRYGSIDDRMTRSQAVDAEDEDEDLAIYRRRSGDSRLRVLSPVSQTEEADVRSHRHGNEDHDDNEDDDDDEDDDDEEEEDFQEARTGTSFSETSHIDQEEQEDNTDHRIRKRRRRRPSHSTTTSSSKDWRHRIEQALSKMSTEIAALREQLDCLPITHSHHSHSHSYSLRKPSGFFSWLLSWGKWFLFHSLRQLLWQSILLSVALVWLRARGDTRLEQRVITILLQLRKRMMNAIRSVPRRLPQLLHLPIL